MDAGFNNNNYATLSARKEADITSEMLAQIERITGTAVEASEIAVFETSALSTRPITKTGSIFHGARPSEDLLRQMALKLNSGEESVPLHTLHQQGSELPIGRVFQAEVISAGDGESELRALFYLPKSEEDLVQKINLGILDEVSVGVSSQQMLCSKCGFDYLGEEADFSNLWSQTCNSDHTLGEDGAHIKMIGLDKWMELSLVSRGASSKPKIMGRAKQVMGKETYDRIAASGVAPEAVVLFTGSQEKEPAMTVKAEFDAKTAIEGITETLAALALTVEGLVPAAPETPSIEDVQAELDAANALVAEFTAAAEAEAAAAELALTDGTTETTLIGKEDLPIGGVAASAVSDADKKALKPDFSSFKTRK